MTSPRLRLALPAALVITLLAPVPSAGGAGGCFDDALPITVEEQRLDVLADPEDPPAAQQILAATRFDRAVERFTSAICERTGFEGGLQLVRRHGKALWERATARAQSDDPAGTLPASDDRALYWARLSFAKAIHQWTPADGLTGAERDRLSRALERFSRGITTSDFDGGSGVKKILVTGFDPFTLDADIRIGNPSGANALTLDGQRWRVGGQSIEIQAMVFPVRYADFDQRMVEHALRPHHRSGELQADMVMTVSQGRPNLFDLEVWNGRRRSVSSIGDNNNKQGGGTYFDPVVPPRMPPGPEFLRSNLPVEDMAEATVPPPFTTRINPRVVEIPAGEEDPVARPDGPTKGSIAVEGSGGGYLSNEIAYRNTLLRRHVHDQVPSGHLHVPVLNFAPGNPDEITDPTYEANRDKIVDGAWSILRKGIAAIA